MVLKILQHFKIHLLEALKGKLTTYIDDFLSKCMYGCWCPTLLPLSRDNGTPGQELFFVPGQRDNGTSRPLETLVPTTFGKYVVLILHN